MDRMPDGFMLLSEAHTAIYRALWDIEGPPTPADIAAPAHFDDGVPPSPEWLAYWAASLRLSVKANDVLLIAMAKREISVATFDQATGRQYNLPSAVLEDIDAESVIQCEQIGKIERLEEYEGRTPFVARAEIDALVANLPKLSKQPKQPYQEIDKELPTRTGRTAARIIRGFMKARWKETFDSVSAKAVTDYLTGFGGVRTDNKTVGAWMEAARAVGSGYKQE